MQAKIIRTICTWALIGKGKLDLRDLLRHADHAANVNQKTLFQILRKNRNTEYGRQYDFADIQSIDEFRQRVPLSNYETYLPYVKRIYYQNEQNVLTAAKVIGFARSSGSIGDPKIIPLTNPAIAIYTKYTVTRFLAVADQCMKRRGVRHKPARGICALPRFEEVSPYGLPSTNVADVAAKKYGIIYPFILNLPLGRQFLYDDLENKYAQVRFGLEDRDALFLFSVFSKTIAEVIEYIRDNWQMLVKDIEQGTIDPSIPGKPQVLKKLKKRLKPNPKRAQELRAEFEKGFDETIISRIWPNMMVISTIGTSEVFEPFTNSILRYTKGIAFDYSIYGASEGLFAAAYQADNKGLLMLPDSCFYEFIDPDDDSPYPETRTLDQLEVDREYEVVITNQMGFYRYRFGDIIKVLGYRGECPIVNFIYRKGQLLNISGEKTSFLQMSEAIRRLREISGAEIKNWSVFVEKGRSKYCYGVALETEDEEDLSGYADRFEQILRDVNPSYRYYEGKDLIDPPVIYMLRRGTHEAWKQMKVSKGASPEQVKPVNILDTAEKLTFFLNQCGSGTDCRQQQFDR